MPKISTYSAASAFGSGDVLLGNDSGTTKTFTPEVIAAAVLKASSYAAASEFASGDTLIGDDSGTNKTFTPAVIAAAVLAQLCDCELTIPDRIYAASGRENNVYFANCLRTTFPALIEFDITCDKGSQQNERWTLTATDDDIPSGNISDISWKVDCYAGDTVVGTKTTTLRIAKAAAGTGQSRKVLCIGDSTGYGWLPELMNLFDGDALTVTLVGQYSYTANDADAESRTAAHEALGGNTWARVQSQQFHGEDGDAANQCSGWTVAGHLATNTDAKGYLYWKLTNAYGPELMSNTGFETAGAGGADVFANWTELTDSGAIADEGSVVKTGSHAAKLTKGATYPTAWYETRIYTDAITVLPSTAYRLSLYARGDGTNAPAFAIDNASGGGYITGEPQTTGVTAAEYTLVNYDFTTPANCTSVRVYLVPPTVVGGYGYFDDVSLKIANQRTVDVYKNSDGADGNKVATGTRTGDGAITLSAANASGLTGTVTVAYTADDTTVSANILYPNFLVRSGSAVDFAQYCTDTSTAMAAHDWVLIHLGINDVGTLDTDAEVTAYIAATLQPALVALVGIGGSPANGSIRESVSGIRVGIMLPIPPSQDQDAFGQDYQCSIKRRRYNRNISLLREWLITTYGDMEANDIYLVPVHLSLDSYYNMQFAGAAAANARVATTINRQYNGVHPDTEAYWQMADAVYAFLKGQET